MLKRLTLLSHVKEDLVLEMIGKAIRGAVPAPKTVGKAINEAISSKIGKRRATTLKNLDLGTGRKV